MRSITHFSFLLHVISSSTMAAEGTQDDNRVELNREAQEREKQNLCVVKRL